MPNQDLSLVPADPSSQQFSTKGSLDWVGLGRVQFSASVAVLARLSGAGVEPLTVAVGQAMCSRIPLGVHGEKVLMEAMSKLKAFSSAGDMIWFGVEVRHILRTLVQTSQGASLVALCAALAEGYSIPTAALVIFEMSKVLGSPEDLRPSFAQWQTLVKVCSSVLTLTTFGLRLQQLLNLCKSEHELESPIAIRTGYGDPAYPPEFAEAVLAIGRVAAGTLQDIELTGGASCAWLAVLAEYLLGLRVQVRKDSGQLLTMNHSIDQKSQVVVILGNSDIATSALRCTGQSYVISSGADFIKRFFEGVENLSYHTSLTGGRVPWHSMLHDVFGDVVDKLLTPVTGRQWMSALKFPVNIESSWQDAFLTMIVYAAERIVSRSPAFRYGSGFSFLQQAPTKLPELTPIRDLLLKKSHELRQLRDPTEPGECSEISNEAFEAAEARLATFCGCEKHKDKPGRKYVYCIVLITDVIISLLCMLEHLDLDSPISPSRYGVIRLYELHANAPPPVPLHWRFISGYWLGVKNLRLMLYNCLFSGWHTTQPRSLSDRGACAFGEGAIYCYIDTVKDVTDKLEQAYRVHVGAGNINLGSQHRDWIFDGRNSWNTSRYSAEELVFDDGFANLFTDTTSSTLRMKPVVSEGVNASFGYEFSNGEYYTHVSPAALTEELFDASLHRVLMSAKGYRQTPYPLIEHKQLRVLGEGHCQNVDLEDYTFNIILRPHHDNLLGRIVCLTHAMEDWPLSRDHVCSLVDNEEDLARAKLRANGIASRHITGRVTHCFIS